MANLNLIFSRLFADYEDQMEMLLGRLVVFGEPLKGRLQVEQDLAMEKAAGHEKEDEEERDEDEERRLASRLAYDRVRRWGEDKPAADTEDDQLSFQQTFSLSAPFDATFSLSVFYYQF